MKLGELKCNSKEAFDGSIIEALLDEFSELTEEEQAKMLEYVKDMKQTNTAE